MALYDQWGAEKASDWVVTPPDGETPHEGKAEIKISERSWDPADWTPEQKLEHAAFEMARSKKLSTDEIDALFDAIAADDYDKLCELLSELNKKIK